MKHLKKLASVLLALVMAAALMMPAFAATAPVITITNPNGHIFTAYQIFKGEKADGSSLKPDSIEWGDYVTAAGKTAIVTALKNEFPGNPDKNPPEKGPFDDIDSNNPVAEDLAAVLSSQFMNKGPYDTDAMRKRLGTAIGGTITVTPPSVSQSVTLNGTNPVEVGWVLITEQLNAQDTNPTFMLQQVTESESVSRKTQDTGVTKEVWDPEIGDGGGWSDAAIYPISDEEIRFQITVALPDNLSTGYKNASPQKHYNVELHDVQAAALTGVQIKSVKLLGKTGTEIMTLTENKDYFTVTGTTTHEGKPNKPACTFEINIPNVESLTNVEDSGSIVVEYTAKLNGTDIKTGADGNLNHVELWVDGKEYEDNVKVFALELDVNKVDGDGNPLTGAEFTLYKEEDWDTTNNVPKKIDGTENDRPGIQMSKNSDKVTVGEGESAVEWEANTRFSVKGLEAGTYYLTETPPSPDYTAIKPIKIVINASTTEKDGPEAGVLTVTVTSDPDRFTESGGIISSTIENIKGTLLPETGGIGTTIFYIVGGVLVVGAVVLLITKRRAGADEE